MPGRRRVCAGRVESRRRRCKAKGKQALTKAGPADVSQPRGSRTTLGDVYGAQCRSGVRCAVCGGGCCCDELVCPSKSFSFRVRHGGTGWSESVSDGRFWFWTEQRAADSNRLQPCGEVRSCFGRRSRMCQLEVLLPSLPVCDRYFDTGPGAPSLVRL
jgi:hypothetical protein